MKLILNMQESKLHQTQCMIGRIIRKKQETAVNLECEGHNYRHQNHIQNGSSVGIPVMWKMYIK